MRKAFISKKNKTYTRCISCRDIITKTSTDNPYLCRHCQNEMKQMDFKLPVYYGEYY